MLIKLSSNRYMVQIRYSSQCYKQHMKNTSNKYGVTHPSSHLADSYREQ